ncbi:MAG TPA: tetratricopeptide repeat protein [Vicinamibacterales bacterium]|nr:tetratricopeptide repeat protein [Vicinamibacterales bacterium]
MRKTGAGAAALIVSFALAAPGPARAANKEHQQIMAELRMLQEQQMQLQQLLGGLSDTLKVITSRLDDQSGTTRKAFADQKLLIDGVAETARILREKADDTGVRLSSMTQELQALRQTIAAMPVPAPTVPGAQAPFPEGAPADPGAQPPAAVPTAPAQPPPNISPTQMWDRVYADYTGGHYDLAVTGFEAFIRTFPNSPNADDAQLYIGYSLHAAGKFEEAAAALQKVINDYPGADTVPQAYYKLGLTYEAMKQVDLARRAYETVLKNHPNTIERSLAAQALERLKPRGE